MIEFICNGVKSCIQSPTAIVGIVASIIVLISMCFNTQTRKGNLIMRLLNGIGSIICVVYSIMLGIDGIGSLLLNSILVFVNFYYLIVALREH